MKAWAALIIRGNISHEEILHTLQLKPDFVYESNFTHWQLNSKLSETENLANHLYEILKQVAPVRKKLQSLHNRAEIIFYCSVEYNSSREGGVILEPRLLTLLAHLGARLEIHRFKNSREVLIDVQNQNDE